MTATQFTSKAAVARWLHDLAERAFSIEDEDALYAAAYLVDREWDRRKFDRPLGALSNPTKGTE